VRPRVYGSFGWLAGAASALALSAWGAAAEAKTTIAGDLDYAAGIDSGGARPGGGFGIRVGQQIHVPLVVFNPELGFTYHSFSKDSSPKVYRGIAGVRLGVGEILRPGLFAHVGLGRLDLAGLPDRSHTAFTYDAGVFIDFTALPLLDIGVHAAYNRVTESNSGPTFQFGTAGAHLALVF
jgi:hypothetical protein